MDDQYRIILERDHEVEMVFKTGKKPENSTVGYFRLFKNEEKIFEAFSIENGGPSTKTSNQDKRIMPGSYKLRYSNTSVPLPKSCEGVGLLLDDPFDPTFIKRRIFIHMGNYPQDTEGCILLNASYDITSKCGYGSNSKLACERFYAKLKNVNLSQVTLVVRELGYDSGKVEST